ncbi:hypothetical protein QE152_g4252 [Popillia japonica]|uniref:Reverse transcriptase domain-containing protein n=1 Tax=Popillia japonica TaxID=7064 RepID=A0AAW1N155_POPJA
MCKYKEFALDNAKPCMAVFADFAKAAEAFDTVSHSLLLRKLDDVGVKMESYLSDRVHLTLIITDTAVQSYCNDMHIDELCRRLISIAARSTISVNQGIRISERLSRRGFHSKETAAIHKAHLVTQLVVVRYNLARTATACAVSFGTFRRYRAGQANIILLDGA